MASTSLGAIRPALYTFASRSELMLPSPCHKAVRQERREGKGNNKLERKKKGRKEASKQGTKEGRMHTQASSNRKEEEEEEEKELLYKGKRSLH